MGKGPKHVFLQIPEGSKVGISQHVFLNMKGKKVKQSDGSVTDGEQDQLGKSLLGLKGKTAEMPVSRVTPNPTYLVRLYFLA